MPPSRTVCASPTAVTTPTVGLAISHRLEISPNPRIPISTTTTSDSDIAFNNVNGTPCSLLKLFGLDDTTFDDSAPAMRFFVDVLPTLPVTPTTAALARNVDRTFFARRENARIVSLTLTRVPVVPAISCETSAHEAPLENA